MKKKEQQNEKEWRNFFDDVVNNVEKTMERESEEVKLAFLNGFKDAINRKIKNMKTLN